MTALTHRQKRAALLIASGKPLAEVCSDLGVAERTLRKWRSTPAFVREVDRQQTALIDEMRNRVVGHAVEAIATLAAIAADPTAAPSARVKAATAILDRAFGRPRQTLISDISIQEIGKVPEFSEWSGAEGIDFAELEEVKPSKTEAEGPRPIVLDGVQRWGRVRVQSPPTDPNPDLTIVRG